MKGTIPINTVLVEIRQGRPLSLLFVRGNGSKEGEYKRVKCIYGKRGNPHKRRTPTTASPRKKALHKYASTIPLIDTSTGKPCTPYIYNLVEYNGHIIRH